MRDLNAKLPDAPSFRYREFVRSQTAARKGIENKPTEAQWRCIELLAKEVLQPVRDEFGSLRITSGFRSVELCEAVGSDKNSNHARGQAADIEPVDFKIKLVDVIAFIYNELEFRTIIAEYFPDGWVHVVYRQGGNDKNLKLKDKDHHYQVVELDYLRDLYK